jgi:hypothetical protein
VHNNRINLTRISRVRFWALLIARAGYANRWERMIHKELQELAEQGWKLADNKGQEVDCDHID